MYMYHQPMELWPVPTALGRPAVLGSGAAGEVTTCALVAWVPLGCPGCPDCVHAGRNRAHICRRTLCGSSPVMNSQICSPSALFVPLGLHCPFASAATTAGEAAGAVAACAPAPTSYAQRWQYALPGWDSAGRC